MASYDSRRVGAGLPVGSRAARMVGALHSWAGAGGVPGPIFAPLAGLDDDKHLDILDIDGCDLRSSVLWICG